MADVLHPLGRGPDGRLVHVQDAQRGRAANVVCLTCGQPFVAAHGQERVWYFRHLGSGAGCSGSLMSDAHSFAQQILLDAREVSLPGGQVVAYAAPVLEARFAGFVVDVLVQTGAEAADLAVEVRYRHQVDDAKRRLIHDTGLAAIEVDISRVPPAVVYDPARFTRYVLHGAPRNWLRVSLAVASVIAWATEHYPMRGWPEAPVPDFAALELGAVEVADVMAGLPYRAAHLALMDQPWWRDHVPAAVAKATWERLEYLPDSKNETGFSG